MSCLVFAISKTQYLLYLHFRKSQYIFFRFFKKSSHNRKLYRFYRKRFFQFRRVSTIYSNLKNVIFLYILSKFRKSFLIFQKYCFIIGHTKEVYFMTIEEQLKEYILMRYKSIREFSFAVDMSNSTLDSILRRGVGNSSLDNIVKICKVLKISVDELSEGKIVPIPIKVDSKSSEVCDILADVKSQLAHSDDLTFDGKPAKRDCVNSLIKAMDMGEEFARMKNDQNS